MRHTTFRFALAPTPAQAAMLARHAGASRFAYNQCRRLVADALSVKEMEPQIKVPWSGFDLINAFNAWKRSEAAGCVFVAASDGTITKQVTGLGWRREVSAQVFEEAAVDLGRALSAYAQAKRNNRGRQVGFPRWKRNGTQLDPGTGQPMVAPRAKVLFATVSRHGSRWYVSLNVQAPDLHTNRRHPLRPPDDHGGFVGLDRGLATFAVAATADGTEVGRCQAPKPLQRGMVRLRRLSRRVSMAKLGSSNRAKATQRVSRQYARIADLRRHFLHEVSCQLIQTHDRLCLEDLAVANLITNRRLARAIGDAAWAERFPARAPDRQAGGRVINAPGGRALAIASMMVQPVPVKGEPTPTPSWRELGHPRRVLPDQPRHEVVVGQALEPAVAAEGAVQHRAGRGHHRQGQRVAEGPGQLGHVLEVHAVDAGDHRWHGHDRHPGRDPAHVGVLLHADLVLAQGDLGQVGLEDAGEQLAEAARVVDHPDQVVLDVAEVLAQLAVQPRDGAVDQPVEWLGERSGGLVELDHLALEQVDALGRVAALVREDLGLDLLDVLVQLGPLVA
jgi:putative transposase